MSAAEAVLSVSTNPNVGTYATRTLYVTPAEFRNAPTGVDTNNLVPGNATASKAALVVQLQRASAAVDNLCGKVLAATVDTETGSYRVTYDDWLGPVLRIPLKFTPIIQVASVQVGNTPNSMAALTDLSNIAYGPKTITVPLSTGIVSSPFRGAGSRQRAIVSYVNGWANTALTTAANAGATAITVASVLGVSPGQQLNIQSTSAAETVTVDPSFVPNPNGINTQIPLTTPLVGTYAPNDTVTAFPQDIKEATILIAKALIKTRGSASMVLASVGGQATREDTLEPGVASDLDIAQMLLEPYRRVW
jgi:hypothetical protein